MAVANAVFVHDVAHLHARMKLVPLRLGAKDTNLRLRQIFQDDLRHVGHRALGIFFENENRVISSHLFHFLLQSGGNFPCHLVGNNCDPLLRFQAKTNANGVARAGLEFRVDG